MNEWKSKFIVVRDTTQSIIAEVIKQYFGELHMKVCLYLLHCWENTMPSLCYMSETCIQGMAERIESAVEYIFNEEVASAYGITNANPQFGKGGLPQYYVPNVQDLIDKEILTLVDSIKLNK